MQNRRRELSRQGRQAAATWNAKNAEEVAKDYRANVHVITGATRDSIAVEIDRATGSAAVVAGEGAIFEEFGTVNRPAHPALIPAIERQKKKMRNRRVNIFKG